MNDEEKDALARRLIAKIVADEHERAGDGPSFFQHVIKHADGELGITYSWSDSLSSIYWPLEDVRQIIAECERTLAEGEIPLVNEKRKSFHARMADSLFAGASNDLAVESLAGESVYVLLIGMRKKLADGLDEAVRDAHFRARAVLGKVVARTLEKTLEILDRPFDFKADFREEVERDVKAVADTRRENLRALLNSPAILTVAPRGPMPTFSNTALRLAAKKLHSEGRACDPDNLSDVIGCEESAIRKRLENEDLTLEDLLAE
jgi:hypothetical protein